LGCRVGRLLDLGFPDVPPNSQKGAAYFSSSTSQFLFAFPHRPLACVSIFDCDIFTLRDQFAQTPGVFFSFTGPGFHHPLTPCIERTVVFSLSPPLHTPPSRPRYAAVFLLASRPFGSFFFFFYQGSCRPAELAPPPKEVNIPFSFLYSTPRPSVPIILFILLPSLFSLFSKVDSSLGFSTIVF